MLEISSFVEKLKKFNTFAIICHVRPDGDAVGSARALKYALDNIGKTAKVFCDDDIPEKFSNITDISVFNKEITGEFDAFVAVDCADETRMGDLAVHFLKHKNTFNIDHHVSNTRYAKYNLIVNNSSNCENIYNVATLLGATITTDLANALLLGISTDTGNFSHKDLTQSAFSVAGELIAKGGDINKIYYETFKKQTKQKALLFAKVNSKIRYMLDDRLAISVISQNDLKETGALISDTEGIIDFVLSIDGVEVAVSILEVGFEKYKISLRGKNTNVNAIASVYGGGGHVLASGCMIMGSLEEVIDRLSYTVSQHLD